MNVIYRTKADFRIAVDDPARKMTGKTVSWYTISIQGAPRSPTRTPASWPNGNVLAASFSRDPGVQRGSLDGVPTTTSAPRRPKIPNLKALPL